MFVDYSSTLIAVLILILPSFLKSSSEYKQLFKNFLFLICKIKKKWNVAFQKKRLIQEIKATVKKDKVICALSGGVDSSVVAQLLNKAIGKKLLIYIYILLNKSKFTLT